MWSCEYEIGSAETNYQYEYRCKCIYCCLTVCMSVCLYVCMYVCVYVYMHADVCVHNVGGGGGGGWGGERYMQLIIGTIIRTVHVWVGVYN